MAKTFRNDGSDRIETKSGKREPFGKRAAGKDRRAQRRAVQELKHGYLNSRAVY